MPNKRRAFGLIEMLVVIVIIAVLALLLIPRLTGAGKRPADKKRTPIGAAKTSVGVSYESQINQAILMYRQDNDNANPPNLQALRSQGITDEMLLDPVTHQPLAYNPATGAVGAAAQAQLSGVPIPAPGGVPPRENVGPGGVSLPTAPVIDVNGGEPE